MTSMVGRVQDMLRCTESWRATEGINFCNLQACPSGRRFPRVVVIDRIIVPCPKVLAQ